jgi:hypothetical protein
LTVSTSRLGTRVESGTAHRRTRGLERDVGKPNVYKVPVPPSDMVRISTVVIVLAIVLGIGLIPIPVIPGVGILVGISGIVLGIVLRLLGY